MDNQILISRLRVTGKQGCDYKLGSGVNIFKGSNSTGKTSLMWFLDFVFGSNCKSDDFVSPVREDCEWVYVDMVINAKNFTIKRNLKEPESIFVYQGIYDTLSEVDSEQAKVYGRLESKERDSITNFYFENLGIKSGKVPISAARVAKYSWRNLMSLIYIQQDKWNGIQAQNNFQPEMKKAVFEIFMGIDDRSINEQEEEKRETLKSIEETKAQQKTIKEFLDKIDRNVGSESSLKELSTRIWTLEQEKDKLIGSIEHTQEANSLLQEREVAKIETKETGDKISSLTQKLEELEMLFSENELNLEKNRMLLNARKVFSELPITRCPKCFNALTDTKGEKCSVCGQSYKSKDNESGYAQNLFLLMDERKELGQIIQTVKQDVAKLENGKQQLVANLSSIEQKINFINKEVISPVMKATDVINSKLNQLNKLLGEAENIRSLLQQERDIAEKIKTDVVKAEVIQKNIDELMKNRVTASEVSKRFIEIMDKILVDILNLDEKLVGFDELYTPTFENGKILLKAGREDINKSKGAKVILGYYTAVLEYSLKYGSYHPKLLILDTPRQDELDMSVFSKILNYWSGLSHYGKPFQIIIAGSEFPPNAGRIIEQFHNRQASGDYSKPDNFSVKPIKLQ